jgi:two-component system NtrC family response regulator
MVKDNLFRKDLYARISTFTLRIKPLRQRMGDIPPILKAIGEVLKIDNRKIQEFLQKYQEDYLNDKYDLSLNVRSLEQALKRFNVLGKI